MHLYTCTMYCNAIYLHIIIIIIIIIIIMCLNKKWFRLVLELMFIRRSNFPFLHSFSN